MLYFFVKPFLYHDKKRVMIDTFEIEEPKEAQKLLEKGWIPLDIYYEGIPVYL